MSITPFSSDSGFITDANVSANVVTAFDANVANSITANLFIGNFQGNITGNLVVPGANTQVLYNNEGNAGASINFTFDAGNANLNVNGNLTANYLYGDGSNITNLPAGNTGNITFVDNLIELNPASPQHRIYLTPSGGGGNASIGVPDDSIANTSALQVTNTVGNTIITGGGTGTPQATITLRNTGNVELYAESYVNIPLVAGNSIIIDPASANILNVGNLSAQYLYGDGSNITNLPAGNYSNANVQAYLPTYTGNVGAGNVNAVFLYGDGSNITNLPAGNYSNANVAAFLGSANSSPIVTTGNISTTTNITAGFLYGDGSNITNLPAGNYSNSNVQSYMANFGSNVISTTGNVTANYFIGNGSLLTNLPAGNYSNANVVAFLGSGNNAPILTTANITTTTNVNAAFFHGDGSNITNLPAGNYSNSNVQSYLANFGSNTISTTGNVTAGFFLGDGSQLTNLPVGNYSNANVGAYLPTYTGNVGAGNVVANYLWGDGSNISGLNIPPAYDDANVSAYLASGADTANITTSGNINASYLWGDGSNIANLFINYGNANVEALLSSGTVTTDIITTANIAIEGSGELTVASNNQHGGTGYAGIMTMTNTSANVTNPNKFLRLNNTGTLEIVNSAYSGVIFQLDDTGDVSATGNISGSSLSVGTVYANSANAIVIGSLGVSNVAINLPNETAIRNYGDDTLNNSIYFDVNIAGANAGQFQFRGSNSFTNYATINSAGVTSTANITGGNIVGTYLWGDGSNISNISAANISGLYGNSNVANYLPTYTGIYFMNARDVYIGELAGETILAGSTGTKVGIGYLAGQTDQGLQATAVGWKAGATNQGSGAVAFGAGAGITNQSANATAIGFASGGAQGQSAVALGANAGYGVQGANAVALGAQSASANQGGNAIAIGFGSAANNQSANAIVIGYNSGNNQGNNAIVIGANSAANNQSANSIVIGYNAGSSSGNNSIAIGLNAFANSAGIAIGANASTSGTGVAIGPGAGAASTGVAIGINASAAGNSVVLGSTTSTGSGLYTNLIPPYWGAALVPSTSSNYPMYLVNNQIITAPIGGIASFSTGQGNSSGNTYSFGGGSANITVSIPSRLSTNVNGLSVNSIGTAFINGSGVTIQNGVPTYSTLSMVSGGNVTELLANAVLNTGDSQDYTLTVYTSVGNAIQAIPQSAFRVQQTIGPQDIRGNAYGYANSVITITQIAAFFNGV